MLDVDYTPLSDRASNRRAQLLLQIKRWHKSVAQKIWQKE